MIGEPRRSRPPDVSELPEQLGSTVRKRWIGQNWRHRDNADIYSRVPPAEQKPRIATLALPGFVRTGSFSRRNRVLGGSRIATERH